jgi:uncharacterized membrane protein YhaH (DUF805 family)
MTLRAMLFGFDGRIRRRDFWLWSIINCIGLCSMSVFLTRFFVDTALDGSSMGVQWFHNLAIIAALSPFFWIGAALNIKRLHDVGRSYRWWRINLVPVLGWAWTFFECGLKDGMPGPNRYGPSPKGLGDPEKVFE